MKSSNFSNNGKKSYFSKFKGWNISFNIKIFILYMQIIEVVHHAFPISTATCDLYDVKKVLL
jgi:hypothetical protein